MKHEPCIEGEHHTRYGCSTARVNRINRETGSTQGSQGSISFSSSSTLRDDWSYNSAPATSKTWSTTGKIFGCLGGKGKKRVKQDGRDQLPIAFHDPPRKEFRDVLNIPRDVLATGPERRMERQMSEQVRSRSDPWHTLSETAEKERHRKLKKARSNHSLSKRSSRHALIFPEEPITKHSRRDVSRPLTSESSPDLGRSLRQTRHNDDRRPIHLGEILSAFPLPPTHIPIPRTGDQNKRPRMYRRRDGKFISETDMLLRLEATERQNRAAERSPFELQDVLRRFPVPPTIPRDTVIHNSVDTPRRQRIKPGVRHGPSNSFSLPTSRAYPGAAIPSVCRQPSGKTSLRPS